MMLEYGVVILTILISSASSAPLTHNGEYIVPNSTAECANDLVGWCKRMDYPKQEDFISMMSMTVTENSDMIRFFCVSGSNGTNCTKNGSPWIFCSKDKEFSFEGKQISKNSSNGVDKSICKASDMAFNNLFIQNLSTDNTTLNEEFQRGVDMMFHQLAQVKSQMESMMNFFSTILNQGNSYDFDDSDGLGDSGSDGSQDEGREDSDNKNR